METDAAYTNLLYWKLKLWIYLLAHRREIEIRAGAGDPGAMEILALQDLAGEYPTRGSLQALLVALDEYRCALLN